MTHEVYGLQWCSQLSFEMTCLSYLHHLTEKLLELPSDPWFYYQLVFIKDYLFLCFSFSLPPPVFIPFFLSSTHSVLYL